MRGNMQIRVIDRAHHHLTAIDKRIIAAAIEHNWPVAESKRKQISLSPTGENTYQVTVTEKHRDDYGRMVTSLYRCDIEVL